MADCVEQIVWHEVKTRKLTDEEKAEYADYEVPQYMFDCEMPSDGQEILVVTEWGVSTDICSVDCDEFNSFIGLENRGDWEDVLA